MENMDRILDIKYSKKLNGYYVIYGVGFNVFESRFFSKDDFLYFVKTLFFDAKKYNEIVRLVAYHAECSKKYSNLGDDNE